MTQAIVNGVNLDGDLDIDWLGNEFAQNQSALNKAFFSNHSGLTEPPVTYPGMIWHKSDTDEMFRRNAVDDAWLTIGGGSMSELRAKIISDLAGTGPVTLTGQSAAKAWIHYDQSPSTIIGDSFNVDSITDVGTGNQIVAYTSVFSNARYAGAATSRGVGNVAWQSAPLVGSVNVQTVGTNTGAQHDYNHVCVTWHGDLA